MRPRAVLAEFRTLGVLAAPIVVTQLSQMGMGVADAIMAGRVGAVELAGVTLGGNFYWPFLLLMTGIVMAVTPSVSQLDGAGRVGESGAVVRQALWIALVGGLVGVALTRDLEAAYQLLGVDPRAIPVAVGYVQAASLGLLPMLAYVALRCLCEGMSWTRPAMIISLSALGLKVPLNLLFIHGSPALGVPAMGGVGCGWATAVVAVYSLTAMVLVVLFSRVRASQVFQAFSWPQAGELLRLLRLGLPIGVALFVEVGFFSFVTLLIGRLGVDVVAAHQVAMNVVGVSFMVPLALGMAATIRVGFNIGAGDAPAARTSALVALATTLVWGACVATVLLVLRHALVGLYSAEAEVVRVAAGLLLLGALFQVFDSSQATTMGALRGYKDTRSPMVIALVAYWCAGLPVGALLCFGAPDLGAGGIAEALGHLLRAVGLGTVQGLGVRGFWWGLVVGLAAASLLLVLRLLRVSRRPFAYG